ncbi:pilus assembly protein [Xaviernesmea oryzae]|uniref:Pilus assembly protein n=1 Tax=Xaviernesmea oryzae TaxID=464029 RepID=A0A1Q9B205_9HYPH|nr:Flp family type IVb pilin [Xaviernesmea oryzae]OLP62043.1 pilus assembly protein [Xaviernesmea oryzae]
MTGLVRMLKDRSGATALEYGLIAALIAGAFAGGAKVLGVQLNSTFENVKTIMRNS